MTTSRRGEFAQWPLPCRTRVRGAYCLDRGRLGARVHAARPRAQGSPVGSSDPGLRGVCHGADREVGGADGAGDLLVGRRRQSAGATRWIQARWAASTRTIRPSGSRVFAKPSASRQSHPPSRTADAGLRPHRAALDVPRPRNPSHEAAIPQSLERPACARNARLSPEVIAES
jgi:hypothetical protein